MERALEGLSDPRRRAFLRGLWVTGARLTELRGLTPGDVVLAENRTRRLVLRTLKRRTFVRRAVAIPADYVADLAELAQQLRLAKGDRYFPWGRATAWRFVRAALVAAGVESSRATTRALRHGHAIHAIESGAPLTALQGQLGHASIVTTSHYLRATAADISRAYGRVEW